MKKIKFIVCWFGEWPVWFPGFLLSCMYNKDIEWLFFTDCKIPANHPDNVMFKKCNMNYISTLASEKLNHPVKFERAYKLCDLRPAYGVVFEDYIRGYDFWGFCDLDVVFGDIKKFITDDILNNNEIITSRKHVIAGHFTLLKNTPKINTIYKNIKTFMWKLNRPKSHVLDEWWGGDSRDESYLKQNAHLYKISWDKWLLNFPDKYVDDYKQGNPSLINNCGPWYWNKGKIFKDNEEIMYLHFKKWKGTISSIDFSYEDKVDSFLIGRKFFKKHS